MDHIRVAADSVPYRLRQDFIAAIFERLKADGPVDVVTMQQLNLALSHSIRWLGLRG
ncbi:MAG: hypothetical protein WBX49_00390 [Candidatus Deferrimicrobiaceae bacterium]